MEIKRPKIVIIGSSGFLGHHLATRLRNDYLVCGVSFRHYTPISGVQNYSLDPEKFETIDMVVRGQSPDFVINAAGIHDPEYAKANGKLSDTLNSVIPVSLAVVCARIKAKFIHLNCTSVYAGTSGNYKEDSGDLALISEFGKQKIAAESFVKTQTMESTLLRVGKVMGIGSPHSPSLFDQYRKKLAGTDSVEASTKMFDSYLSTHSLGSAFIELLKGEFPAKHRVFNIGGPRLSERDFLEGWANLITKNSGLLKNKPDDSPLDHSISSALFEKTFPQWKQEKTRTLYENLWQEFFPAFPIPPSQRSKLNNYFPPGI